MADLKEQHQYESQPPRQHHYLFVHRFLRDRVLKGPLDFFQRLQEDNSIAYLKAHWAILGIQVQEGDSGDHGFVPPYGLEIFPMVMWNGCSIIIVQLPKPERMTEAYFAGIAFWEDSGLRRFFTLELTEDELGNIPGGLLCEWSEDGHRNYERIIPPEKDLFFDAVREVLRVEQSRDLMEEYRQTLGSDEITFYDSQSEYGQAVGARLWLYEQYSSRVETAGSEGGWAAAEREFNKILIEDPRVQPLRIHRIGEGGGWIVVHP
jgi:hypothetical protein